MKMASWTDKWKGERSLARIEYCLSSYFFVQMGFCKRCNPMAELQDKD